MIRSSVRAAVVGAANVDPTGTRGLPRLSVNFHLGILDQLIVILAAFTKAFRAAGVGYTSSASLELYMLAVRAKERRRMLVKCLPTARSLPLHHEDFGMSRFKDRCRDCTIFPARLKASRCPQWTCDVFSVSWARDLRLGNRPRRAGAAVTGGQLAQ